MERPHGLRRNNEPGDVAANDVFLNVPYDREFTGLFLAYIAGLAALGLSPRTTLEIPGGEPRLDRILALILSCPSSIHDLSRIDTPRFNMPFELGLAVACQKIELPEQKWLVFATGRGRIEKALSDLGGTDVYIHYGRPAGVFAELTNAFVRSRRRATVNQMGRVFAGLQDALPGIKRDAGTTSCFKARVFEDLCILASKQRPVRGLTWSDG